jgi:hypothetical protein
VAQIDRLRDDREWDVLLVEIVRVPPCDNPVLDAGARLSRNVDDATLCHPSAEPWHASGNSQAERQAQKGFAASCLADGKANLSLIENPFDQRPSVELWPDISEADQLDFMSEIVPPIPPCAKPCGLGGRPGVFVPIPWVGPCGIIRKQGVARCHAAIS